MTGGNDTKQQVTIIGWAWHNDTGGAQNEDNLLNYNKAKLFYRCWIRKGEGLINRNKKIVTLKIFNVCLCNPISYVWLNWINVLVN